MRILQFLPATFLAIVQANELQFSPRDLPPPIAANSSSYTDCANAAWPPSEVGVELVPQAPNDELKAMLNEEELRDDEMGKMESERDDYEFEVFIGRP